MLLVCATFPLVWVGSLVTTFDAGMAVPDWPSTYGYNLFLYPWTTWLFGPFDLMIEHGHRLLGAAVGMITIGLLVSVWIGDSRRWMRGVAVAALAAVIFQGLLGGARVIQNEVQLAKVHGIFGPAFFAFACAIGVMTSARWKTAPATLHAQASKVKRLAILTTALVYFQLIIGANLRHIPVDLKHGTFRILVVFHILVAVAVLAHVLMLFVRVHRQHRDIKSLWSPALLLVVLMVAQLALGAGTWVVNYGWPSILSNYQFAAAYTVEAHGGLQAMIVSAHVATGSLILALSTTLSVRSLRLLRAKECRSPSSATLVGGLV